MSLKILLAPSETKKQGGLEPFFSENLLFAQALSSVRESLMSEYNKIVTTQNQKDLSEFFGLKKEQDIYAYAHQLSQECGLKAIERYSGVAFDYLDYSSLDMSAKSYLHEHLILFSNLFGFLKSDDIIPDYRVKQGSNIGSLSPQKIYANWANLLDEYMRDDDILDLRAGYYDKFYKPNKPYTTLKFLKEGKVVSHWAKAYRGIISREIALNQINSMDKFIALSIKGLSLVEIQEKKNIRQIIYEVNLSTP